MKIPLRILAAFTIALKQLFAQRGLSLATLLGLVITVALTMSIPLYTEGVYYRMLSEGLFSDTPHYRGQMLRPPVSLLFRYIGSSNGPLQWPDIGPLDDYFAASVYRDLHLPPSPTVRSVRMFNTGIFGVFTAADVDVVTDKQPMYWAGFTALSDLAHHITLVEGELPADTAAPDGVFDVLMSRFFAEKMGIQVGEVYIAYDLRAMHKYEDAPTQFEMRVAGIWEPANLYAEFWDYTPIYRDNILFVSEVTFSNRISPVLKDEIYQALWYLPLDAENIYISDVDPLLLRIQRLQMYVTKLLPNTILNISPVKALERYQSATNELTGLLFTFSVPVISLLITFVVLIVALTVEHRRNQVAMLRSRGASMPQVTGVTALEAFTLGLFALGLALPISLLLAYTIGQVRSFLDFSLATDIRVGMTWATVRVGLVVVGLTMLAQIVPAWNTARHTIVTYKHTRARLLRPPWWQRAWLDILTAIPAVYGTYLLYQQSIVAPSGEAMAIEPLQNPLLFLVPALSLLSLTLLILRVLPLLMRAFAWIGAFSRNVGFLLAARQLARAPTLYAAPLGLLILTLSLSTYTASLSATLDTHLYDQQYYWVGADMSLVDAGEVVGAGAVTGVSEAIGVSEAAASGDITGHTQWQFLHISEYEKLPGIAGAARVGRYDARVQTGNSFQDGTFMGVDRSDFVNVAFWRGDFAPESLGGLMNQLAIAHDGVLLPREFMETHALDIGDTLHVIVISYEQAHAITFKIAGSFTYFPTWYPDTGPLIVGNLDYFFQEAQGQYPYRVWMKSAPDVDYDRLADDVWEMNLGAQAMFISTQRIYEEQRSPGRQGLLGLLSVGFGAAAVLSALGFMLYILFSFRRRAVEMGVLRASGLSIRQMASFVAWELLFLLIAGGVAGTALGIWASNLFVPMLQTGTQIVSHIPPLSVEIAWPAILRLYALFALLFIIALTILVYQLLRMKLFQVIKLGETV
ncbi:MAG: ABC transporter permease [Anaerolineae bacterium]|nr:ABC transporter permease [Anaerolineae bacterium]